MAGYTPEAMRERFRELEGQIKAIEDVTLPKRIERDALVNAVDTRVKDLETEYLEAEKPLFGMKSELAAIARFLNGKTGEPEEPETIVLEDQPGA